ncbi:MAG: hypothetical protein ACD_41C00024G0008 [uncultured bacterium]|nr:MAG: hypothetical protein ACD_41C00024G0008 [uncultured bacterium]
MKIRSGFSLFEVTVYIAIISVVMVAVLGIVAQTVLNRIKVEALHNVTASTRFAIERMSQDVRAAADISGTTITLADGTTEYYYVTGGQLLISTNGGTGVALTPSNLTVTEFSFTDRTTVGSDTKDISITLAVENDATNPRPEYQADFSLTTTVSARL